MSLKNINQDCVLWEGRDLPCLSVCRGDTLTTPVSELAEFVCKQYDILDSLKELDLSCLEVDCVSCLEEKTVKDFIQLLLDNDCKIKKLIDDYQDSIDNSEDIVKSLDLKCLLDDYLLAHPDENKCELDLDTPKVLQVLIDKFCDLLDIYSDPVNDGLLERYLQVKQDFDDFIATYSIYIEPIINSCLTKSTPLILSQHVINNTDKTICDLNDQIGDIAGYLSNPCNVCSEDLFKSDKVNYLQNCPDPGTGTVFCYLEGLTINAIYYVNTLNNGFVNIKTDDELEYQLNFILSSNNLPGLFFVNNGVIFYNGPTTLTISFTDCLNVSLEVLPFSSISNVSPTTLIGAVDLQKNLICILKKRVESIENNCCTIDCNDIYIAFNETYDAENKTYTLTFSSAAGTKIPEIFSDCGSTITLIDHTGKKLVTDVSLEVDGEVELDVSALDNTETISVSIKTCLTAEGITCRKCFGGVLTPIAKCSFCKLCAEGGSKDDYINLIYTSGTNLNEQTTKIFAGQCLTFDLPASSPKIVAVTASSVDITLVTDDEFPCYDTVIPPPIVDTCWFFEIPVLDDFTTERVVGQFYQPLLASQIRTDYDFTGNEPNQFKYGSYRDFLNPGGIDLNHVPLVGLDNGISNDNVYLILHDTIGYPVNVLNVNKCGQGTYHKTWDLSGQGGTAAGWVPLANYPDGKVIIAGIGVGGYYDIKSQINNDPLGSGKWGFILRVSGQPLTTLAVKPEISLISPINGAVVWIKGEYRGDDCGCPD